MVRSMRHVLEVEQVSKRYKNGRGVHKASLTIEKGEVYGLLGPNGAGKTTLLKLITGLSPADEGNVRLFGYSLSDHYEQAMERVGCSIESADAYEYMSGYNNLRLSSRFYRGTSKQRIGEVLDRVGLGPYAHEKVSGYSMGMKQRLAIAAALISKPELVILDEPTNSLDLDGTLDIRHLIADLAYSEGITFIVSSHQIQELEKVCTRFGVLVDGTLIRQISAGEISLGWESLEQFYVSTIKEWKEEKLHAQPVRQSG